jgi:flagellar protein FliO/FliZ
MLPRLIILTVFLAAAADVAAQPAGKNTAQESQRSSAYGPPSRRLVEPAAYAEKTSEKAVESKAPSRGAPLRLAPREESASKELSRPAPSSPTSAVTTVVGSLGIVLGLFVVLVWFSRRFTPAGSAALPKEAVELLGRTSLGGTHQVQLMRVGAKLLLVALTPQGARTLTEITSATEVERLSDLCRRQKPESATASFRTLVEQVGGERTSNTFVDSSRRAPAAATVTSRTRAAARA